jgi:outer membrane receptor protein involved in Fe transport
MSISSSNDDNRIKAAQSLAPKCDKIPNMKPGLLSCTLLCAFAALAQSPSGSVVGRITDPTGAVIPGVVITITSLDTNISQQAATGDTGEFTVPYLNPGRYTLEASVGGFRTHRQSEFRLSVEQVLRIDIRLEVGATTESVTVTDTPPPVNTESGTRGEVATSAEITDLPLDGRNFSDLAYLTGGVLPKGDGGDGSFAVNGGRADNFGFYLDGINNTQRRNTGAVINPPIEGVQEFKVITSGFNAEYGRYAGGMMSLVTKSGSNKLHGSLYEFIRNDIFDATSYFDLTKSKLRRNQFGATLSGPVFLPKLYNGRDRTFFMFTWESLRVVDGKTQRGIVPEPEMLRGDFTKARDALGAPLAVRDPLANANFPGNRIPVSRLDPVSLKMAAYFPEPNIPASVNNFIAQGNATSSNNNFGVKADHRPGSRDRLTLSAFWRPNAVWDPVANSRSPLPFFGAKNNTLDALSYVSYLRPIGSSWFIDLKASFSRKTNNQRWPYSAERDWAAEIGFPGSTTNPVARGLPQFQATGYIILGPAYDLPKVWSFNNYQYIAAATRIVGAHTLKFGGDFLRMQYFSRQYGDLRGRLVFNGRFTRETLADMLLGWPSSSRRQLDAAGPYHLVSNYSGYVQDDWKITPSLTFNLGVRYELMKQPREKFGAWAMFMPEIGKVVISGRGNMSQQEFDNRIAIVGANNVAMASDVGLPPTITRTDYTNFGPRLGFAWRIFGNNRTVLRGGYGMFYGSSSLYRMDEYADTYPFSINETFSISGSNPTLVTASNPFPTSRANAPAGVTSSTGQQTSSPQSQYLQSWSLTFERELSRGAVLEVAYAGSKGTHLQRRYDTNQPLREIEFRTIRPFQAFGAIQIITDGSNSIYNSGSVTLRRRFNRQFTVRASYTYAKSIDESSNTGGTIQYNFSTAQDPRNLKGERGRSDFDIGHTFLGLMTWEMRFSKHPALRNWQISATSSIYTGPPFTPRLGTFDYNNGGASRPDRLGKGTLHEPGIDQWFDRTQFPAVPLGSYRFGSSGRNILDGPGTINLNTGLSRRFRFESKSLQFRMEAINMPNHPNFNLPENRVDIISGGAITRAKNNRTLNLGLRLEF